MFSQVFFFFVATDGKCKNIQAVHWPFALPFALALYSRTTRQLADNSSTACAASQLKFTDSPPPMRPPRRSWCHSFSWCWSVHLTIYTRAMIHIFCGSMRFPGAVLDSNDDRVPSPLSFFRKTSGQQQLSSDRTGPIRLGHNHAKSPCSECCEMYRGSFFQTQHERDLYP